MSIFDATLALVDQLNAQAVDYLLVGSLAASFYGLSRATTDADFVLQLGQHKLSDIILLMGANYRLDPQPGFEIFTGKRVDVIYVIGTPFKIDVFPLTDDTFDQERFGRRVRARWHDRDIFLPTAEDVVIMKLRWRRPLDLEDAKYVLRLQSGVLDWPYIERWCNAHGTRKLLDDLRGKIPPNP